MISPHKHIYVYKNGLKKFLFRKGGHTSFPHSNQSRGLGWVSAIKESNQGYICVLAIKVLWYYSIILNSISWKNFRYGLKKSFAYSGRLSLFMKL